MPPHTLTPSCPIHPTHPASELSCPPLPPCSGNHVGGEGTRYLLAARAAGVNRWWNPNGYWTLTLLTTRGRPIPLHVLALYMFFCTAGRAEAGGGGGVQAALFVAGRRVQGSGCGVLCLVRGAGYRVRGA